MAEPGPTLAGRIQQGRVPEEEAVTILVEIADALEYAQERGVIPRDLKPANIKIHIDDMVKILDFGLAKELIDPAGTSRLPQLPHEFAEDHETMHAQSLCSGISLGKALGVILSLWRASSVASASGYLVKRDPDKAVPIYHEGLEPSLNLPAEALNFFGMWLTGVHLTNVTYYKGTGRDRIL